MEAISMIQEMRTELGITEMEGENVTDSTDTSEIETQTVMTRWIWKILRWDHEKHWDGRHTSRNQDCWEKYQ